MKFRLKSPIEVSIFFILLSDQHPIESEEAHKFMDYLQVVLQFLQEEGYGEAFEVLKREAEVEYFENKLLPHTLRQAIGDIQQADESAAVKKILSGKKYQIGDKNKKVELTASPICIMNYEDHIYAGMSDGSINKLDKELNIVDQLNPGCQSIVSFCLHNKTLFFGALSGIVGSLDLDSFTLKQKKNLGRGTALFIRTNGQYLVVATRNYYLEVLDCESFESYRSYLNGDSLTGLCVVNNGFLYSIEDDNSFHYRSFDSIDQERFFLMNPNDLSERGFVIREIIEASHDPNVFMAITDKNMAVIYRIDQTGKSASIIRTMNKVVTDGLTQTNTVWPSGPTAFITSDTFQVFALDLEKNIVSFELGGWKRATRCLAVVDDRLYVGAFDKTLAYFELTQDKL